MFKYHDMIMDVTLIRDSIASDGTMFTICCCRLIFKLTDFGATREMSLNVSAQTLYGTEEYLVFYFILFYL